MYTNNHESKLAIGQAADTVVDRAARFSAAVAHRLLLPVVIGWFGFLPAWSVAVAPPLAVIFSSPDCPDCERVKERWLLAAEVRPGTVLVAVDATVPENYAMLAELEAELDIAHPGDLPALYAAGQLIYGGEAIAREWDRLIVGLDEERALPAALRPVAEFAREAAPASPVIEFSEWAKPGEATATGLPGERTAPAGRLTMAVLNQPGCRTCSRMDVVLQALQAELPELVLRRFDLDTAEGRGVLALATKHYGVGDDAFGEPPILLWPHTWRGGRVFSRDDLFAELVQGRGETPFWEPAADAELAELGMIASREFFARFSLGLVIVGGLIDGVNPCAFATVIFLVSYLTCVGRDRRGVALVGGSFCFGVFITYMLLGLGLSLVLSFVQRLVWLNVAVYAAFALGALALAGVHLRDALRYRRTGKSKSLDGGLSPDTTRSIHGWIRKLVASPLIVPACILLGAVISLLELACTGQIYLPILSIINRDGITPKGTLLLVVYCLAFILPLAAVTVLAAVGVRTQAISQWARENLVATKLAMAALFLVISATMSVMLWRLLDGG